MKFIYLYNILKIACIYKYNQKRNKNGYKLFTKKIHNWEYHEKCINIGTFENAV